MFPFIATALAEGAEEKTPGWLSTVFAKFGSILPTVWAIVAVLVLAAVILFVLSRSKKRWNAQMLANGALSIALAFVLSYIRLYKMPQGGSITLASMLPVFLFSYAYGVGPGLFVGLAYGALQWMQDGFWMLTPVEGVMDYLLAYAVLGLCGVAGKLGKLQPAVKLTIGCVIGALARAVVAVTAGVIFFADYAPEGQAPIVYSLLYNGLYLLPDTLICLAVGLPISQRVLKIMPTASISCRTL